MVRHELDRLWIGEVGHRMVEGEMNCFYDETSKTLRVTEEQPTIPDDGEDLLDDLGED